MDSLGIKDKWGAISGALKQKWALLTDDDLQYSEGALEDLMRKIQKRTGKTRHAIEHAIRKIKN